MSTKSTAIFDFLWKNLQKLIKFITKSYLSPLNSFLFSSRFSVSLKSLANNRWFPYKSLLSRFSVLISYNMWTSNHFSISSCFPCFSESRLFRVRVQGPRSRVQVFLDPGPGSRVRVQDPGPGSRFRVRVQVQGPGSESRVRVQVLEVAGFLNAF